MDVQMVVLIFLSVLLVVKIGYLAFFAKPDHSHKPHTKGHHDHH